MKGKKRKGGLRRTWRFYRPYAAAHRRELVVGGLAALGMVGARLALPWPLTNVVAPWLAAPADAERAPRSAVDPDILVAGLVFLGLYVLLGVFDRWSRVWFARFAIDTVGDVRADALTDLEGDDEASGDLLSRLVGDTARLKEGLKGFLVHTVTNGALFLGVVAAMAWIDPRFAALLGAGLVAIALVTLRASRAILLRATKLREKEARLADDILQATRPGKASAAPRLPRSSLEASLTRMQGRAAIAVYLIFGVVIALCFHVASSRPEAGAQLFVLSAYTLILVHPVVRLARQGTRLGKMLACADRIERAVRARRKKPAKVELPELRERIRLEGYRLAASGGRTRPRVGPLDLELRPGERVAVVGPTGAGKSSLLHAIARRRRPDAGRALWDSTDLADVPRRARTERIALASERPLRRRGTVEARLGGRPRLTTPARELLERHGERVLGPADLSESELRALAVEAALLRPAHVVLLDDPVRGVGPDEARRRVAELLAARPDALVLVALSSAWTLELFERVIALERGRVMFDGSPSAYDAFRAVHAANRPRPPHEAI